MFAGIWSRLSKKKNVKEQRIIDLEALGTEAVDEEDDEKTEMIDTLAYHQPSKKAIAEKARLLAEGNSV